MLVATTIPSHRPTPTDLLATALPSLLPARARAADQGVEGQVRLVFARRQVVAGPYFEPR